MRSNPAIHTVRANQRTKAGGSNTPRTAIQPPAGGAAGGEAGTKGGGSNPPRTGIQPPAAAMPSVKPRIQCEAQVKRLLYEEPIRKRAARGASLKQSGLSKIG